MDWEAERLLLPEGSEEEESEVEAMWWEVGNGEEPGREREPGWWERRKQRKAQEEAEYLARVQQEAASKGWPVPETYEQAVELKKREAEAFELGAEVERAAKERKLEELKKLRAQRKKAEQETRLGLEKEAVRWGQRAAMLGGVPAVQRPGGITSLYFGRPGRGLYTPSVPSAERLREIPAKRALRPDLGKLRQAAQLGIPQSVPTDVQYARQLVAPPGRDRPLSYGFLREVTLPKGLSRIEQAAFNEIRANNDVDTLEHVKDELAKLGFSRFDTERAVQLLESKGLIRKQVEGPGEPPVYEIARGSTEASVPPIFLAARGF